MSAYALISCLYGPLGKSEHLFADAVDVVCELLFVSNVPLPSIVVMRDVYSRVAEAHQMSPRTVARSVERAANRFWEKSPPEVARCIIGRTLHDINAPRDMLFYFAYYLHYGKSFYDVMQEEAAISF